MDELSIDKLIPHRGRMKLIETIVHVDDKQAVCEATVRKTWPLWQSGAVSPIICIELVAQTAGIHFGYTELKKNSSDSADEGWIVGIKQAAFYIDAIPDGARVVVTAELDYSSGNYAVFTGRVAIAGEAAGEAVLQVFRPDKEEGR